MARHRYKAIDPTGKVRSGTAIALNQGDLEKRLGDQGLVLVWSRPAAVSQKPVRLGRRKADTRLLIEFYRRFSQTLDMGLPLFTVLEENSRIIPSADFRNALEEIKNSLEEGGSLAEAMGRHPKIFGKLDLALVRMGEQTGVLPQALEDLARFLEWKEENRSVIRRALIYPCFLLLAIGAVIGVWVGYVLPQVGKLLMELGVELPAVTRAILVSSDFLKDNGPMLLVSASIAGILVFAFGKTRKGGWIASMLQLRLPLVGEVVRATAYSRLCHNFAIMHRAGMPVSRIFTTLSDHLLGNAYMEHKVSQAYQELQLGQSLSESFQNTSAFPSLLVEGIRHGEITGKLEDAFRRMGAFYDTEAKRKVQTMINAFEPIMILVMGGVFGLIVLSILLPLYDVLSGYTQAY